MDNSVTRPGLPFNFAKWVGWIVRRRTQQVFGATLVVGSIFFMLEPTLHSAFEMIDDHAIIAHFEVGEDSYPIAKPLDAIAKNQYIEADGRFRPGLIIIEELIIWALKKNPITWHRCAMGIALVTAVLFYLVFLRWVSPPLATLFSVLCFSGFHAEAWIKLLSTEAWGLLSYATGLWILVPKRQNLPLSVMRLFLGAGAFWAAALIKESFLPLYPLTLWVILFGLPILGLPRYDLKARCTSRGQKFVILFFVGGLIIHFICLGLALRGVGYRYMTWTPIERWLTLKEGTRFYFMKMGWILPVVFLCYEAIIAFENRTQTSKKLWASQKELGATIAITSIVWFFPQWVVYGNMIYFLPHYLLPINLFVVFTTAFIIRLTSKKVRTWGSGFIYGISILSVVVMEYQWLLDRHRYALNRAATSEKYQTWINNLVQEGREHSNSKFVFCTAVGLFEHLTSVERFLSEKLRKKARPSIMVRWDQNMTGSTDPMIRWLRDLENKGDDSFDSGPIARDPAAYYIGVEFGGARCPIQCDKYFQDKDFDV